MAFDEQTDLFGGRFAPAGKGRGGRVAAGTEPGRPSAARPLAARMRPRTPDEIVGQEHLTQKGALLPRLIASNRFGSLIFYGPPGCGKTSFAEVIAHETKSKFVRINAVMSNVAELREILAEARRAPDSPTLLFIDELHRFNKSQQDLLLPDVEEGYVRLIGATTHNPGFYVNPPLLSRSHLFRLEPLSTAAVADVLRRALTDTERGLGAHGVSADDAVLEDLAVLCDGDLRRALNSLEVIVLSLSMPTTATAMPMASVAASEEEAAVAAAVGENAKNAKARAITTADLEAFAKERRVRYDADEDEHYDTISVFIKSCRGSDPDAALYWLAKMLAGGEDPRFIARRLVILASEDVGLADPLALPLAVAAHHACDFVGLPECEYALAHATVYIACACKSNSVTLGLHAAKAAVASGVVQRVPESCRSGSGQANKRMGQGKEYMYAHEYPENISGQAYLEKPLSLFTPKTAGSEARIAERLARWSGMRAAARAELRARRPRAV